MAALRTDEVFGVSNRVLVHSYVDRGDLDSDVTKHLSRPTHVAVKGVSKAGKTWLRQSVLPGALVVQCRLGKKIVDIYREALAELGVRLEVAREGSVGFTGSVEGETEVGVGLIG